MGDRTTCYLDIGGAIPRSLANRIMAGAYKDLGEPEYSETTAPTAEAVDGKAWNIVWNEVNYGQIDEDLQGELLAAGLAWRWTWGAGGGYEAGAKWWAPGRNDVTETHLQDSAEVVAISFIQQAEADHPGLLVSELLEKLDPMPDVPPATFVEDVPLIRLGPDPAPETFTVICEGHIHSVVEASSVTEARALVEQRGLKVSGIVKGRCVVVG